MTESPPSSPPTTESRAPPAVAKTNKQARGAMEEHYTRMRDIDVQYVQISVNNSHRQYLISKQES